MLPWAVPEVDPAAVVALFVNEDSGNVIDAQRLSKADACTGLPFLERTTLDWVTTAGTAPSTSRARTRVSSSSSRRSTPCRPSARAVRDAESLSQSAPGLVKCYAGGGNQDGLTFIHGWSDANGTPAAPVIRDAPSST